MSARLALILCLALCTNLVQARSVTISTGEYPPWTGKELPNQGYVNHIISSAFAAVDVETRFVYMPWARAYLEARQGKYDATSYWYGSPERESEMLLSKPLVYNRTVFFQRSGDKPVHWKTLEDLQPYRIAVNVGYTYTPEFHFAINSKILNATVVSNDIQGLKMLLNDRVDLFVADQVAGKHMARDIGVDPSSLRVVEPELVDVNGYLMASQELEGSAELIKNFNRGLKIIKANGKYQKILDEAIKAGSRGAVSAEPLKK